MLLNNYNKLGLMAHVCYPRRLADLCVQAQPGLHSEISPQNRTKQTTMYICTNVQTNYNKMYKFNSTQMSVN